MQERTLLAGEVTLAEKEEEAMADINQFVDKDYEGMDFKELADCPVAALQGLSENDAQVLKQAFGIDTVRELADNKFVRIAQAITALSR